MDASSSRIAGRSSDTSAPRRVHASLITEGIEQQAEGVDASRQHRFRLPDAEGFDVDGNSGRDTYNQLRSGRSEHRSGRPFVAAVGPGIPGRLATGTMTPAADQRPLEPDISGTGPSPTDLPHAVTDSPGPQVDGLADTSPPRLQPAPASTRHSFEARMEQQVRRGGQGTPIQAVWGTVRRRQHHRLQAGQQERPVITTTRRMPPPMVIGGLLITVLPANSPRPAAYQPYSAHVPRITTKRPLRGQEVRRLKAPFGSPRLGLWPPSQLLGTNMATRAVAASRESTS